VREARLRGSRQHALERRDRTWPGVREVEPVERRQREDQVQSFVVPS
jgi:hypothetical protein